MNSNKKKLKIAFVRTNFPTPGSLFFYERVTGLIELGHEIRIFALAPYSEVFSFHEDLGKYQLTSLAEYYGKPKSKIRVIGSLIDDFIRYPKTAPGLFIRSLNVRRYGKRGLSLSVYFLLRTFSKYPHFDIIYGITGPTSAKTVLLKELFPVAKFVVNFAGFDFSSRIRKQGTDIYKQLFNKADLVIAHSFFSRDCILSLGCPPEKIVKHPVGVNLAKFGYKERAIKKNGVLHFITVGRLVEKKAHRIILSAISRILGKGRKLNYHIVGSGELLADIQRQVEDDDLLKTHVFFHGYKTQMEVAQMLNDCHVFIQPSITTMRWAEQEDTTTTLLEAQATGMPVIASYHAGIPEVVINNKTGILVPERNVQELAGAMEFMIDNPAVCREMGRNGRKFIEENFDIEMLNKKLEYLLRKLISLKTNENIGLESTEEVVL